jgi:hypothetical protein
MRRPMPSIWHDPSQRRASDLRASPDRQRGHSAGRVAGPSSAGSSPRCSAGNASVIAMKLVAAELNAVSLSGVANRVAKGATLDPCHPPGSPWRPRFRDLKKSMGRGDRSIRDDHLTPLFFKTDFGARSGNPSPYIWPPNLACAGLTRLLRLSRATRPCMPCMEAHPEKVRKMRQCDRELSSRLDLALIFWPKGSRGVWLIGEAVVRALPSARRS